MTDSRSLDKAPWQVAFTGAALLLIAGCYLNSALTNLLESVDITGIKANLADYEAVSDRLAQASAYDIRHWLEYSAQVFTTLTIVFTVLAFFLWRGILRPGVRLATSIFVLISLLGAIRLVTIQESNSMDIGHAFDVLVLLIHVLAALGCASLWFGAGKRWVTAAG